MPVPAATHACIKIEIPKPPRRRRRPAWGSRLTPRRPFVSVLDALVPLCVDALREEQE